MIFQVKLNNDSRHLRPTTGLLQLGETGGLQQLQVAADLLTDEVVELSDFLQVFLRARVLWPRLIITHGGSESTGGVQLAVAPSSALFVTKFQLSFFY